MPPVSLQFVAWLATARSNTFMLLHAPRSQTATYIFRSIQSVTLSAHFFEGLPLCRTPSTDAKFVLQFDAVQV